MKHKKRRGEVIDRISNKPRPKSVHIQFHDEKYNPSRVGSDIITYISRGSINIKEMKFYKDYIFDRVGNEIREGAILKVYHFTDFKNKKHYMYKQVGELHENGYRKVYHLPYNGEFYSLTEMLLTKTIEYYLMDALVIQDHTQVLRSKVRK